MSREVSGITNRPGLCQSCNQTTFRVPCQNCGSGEVDEGWNSVKNNYDKHDVGEAYFKGRSEQMGLHVENFGIDMRDRSGKIFSDRVDLRLWEPLDCQQFQPGGGWPDHDVVDEFAAWNEEESRVEAAMSHPDIDENELEFREARWECRALVDVKTKANKDWMGVTNLRHLVHYASWASKYSPIGVPVAIYFTMVDMEEESVGEENVFIEVPHEWGWAMLEDHYDRGNRVEWDRRKQIAEELPIVKEAFPAPDGNDVVRFREDAYENFNWFVEEVL